MGIPIASPAAPQPRSPAAAQRQHILAQPPSTDGRLTRYGPSDLHQRALLPPEHLSQGPPGQVHLAPDALRVLRGDAQDVAVEEPDQVKVS